MSTHTLMPGALELIAVMLDPATYPDATVELTIMRGSDWETTYAMCRDHLKQQRSMLRSNRMTNAEDLYAYLLEISEGKGAALAIALYRDGTAKCADCVVAKQGRLPR